MPAIRPPRRCLRARLVDCLARRDTARTTRAAWSMRFANLYSFMPDVAAVVAYFRINSPRHTLPRSDNVGPPSATRGPGRTHHRLTPMGSRCRAGRACRLIVTTIQPFSPGSAADDRDGGRTTVAVAGSLGWRSAVRTPLLTTRGGINDPGRETELTERPATTKQ